MNEELLRRKAFISISWTACFVALGMVVHNFWKDLIPIALDTLFLFAALFTNLIIFYRSRNVTLHTLVAIIFFLVYVMAAAQSLGGQIYFWIYVLPWISFFLLGLNVGTLILIFSVICFATFMHFLPLHFTAQRGEADIIFSFLLVSFTIFSYEVMKLRFAHKIETLTHLDPLTNTWNRRKFQELFEIELARAKRYKRPFSLIMFDIDHFKMINDTYGHQMGDNILQQIAEVVKRNVRVTDYVFRWGGEEFLILAPETKIDNGGIDLAEKLRELIEKTSFPQVGNLTISLGVTEINLTDTLDNLLQKADEALYKAKNAGRNKVETVR